MKRLVFTALAMIFAIGAGETWIHACGSKFLVSTRSGIGLQQLKMRHEATTILVYWQQDEATLEEDRWSSNATELLEDFDHTVTVTFDADAFLTAARDADFEVVMIQPIEEARRLKEQLDAVAPNSVIMPLLWMPRRQVEAAAQREFDRVLRVPIGVEDFLWEINDAGKEARARR